MSLKQGKALVSLRPDLTCQLFTFIPANIRKQVLSRNKEVKKFTPFQTVCKIINYSQKTFAQI